MRLHTDLLTRDDLQAALVVTGLRAAGVWIDRCEEKGSRTHERAFDVTLRASKAPGRRHPNPGTSGRWVDTEEWVPTYDEWGYWLAEVYRRDKYVKAGQYENALHYHEITRNQYLQQEGLPAPFALT